MLKLSTIILLTTSALWCVFFELVSGFKIVESKHSIPTTNTYSKTKAHQPNPSRIQKRAPSLQSRIPFQKFSHNLISMMTDRNTIKPQLRKPSPVLLGNLDDKANISPVQRTTSNKQVMDPETDSELALSVPERSELWDSTSIFFTSMGSSPREGSNWELFPTSNTNTRADTNIHEEEILPVSDAETQDPVTGRARVYYGSQDMLELLAIDTTDNYRKDHLEKCNSGTGFKCYESKWIKLGLDWEVMKQYSELIGLGKHVPMTGPGTLEQWRNLYNTKDVTKKQWYDCEVWFMDELGAGEKTLREWVRIEMGVERDPRLPVWWTDEMLGEWLRNPDKQLWRREFRKGEQEHTSGTTNASPAQHQKSVEATTSLRPYQNPRQRTTLASLMVISDQEMRTEIWRAASPKIPKAYHFTISKALHWSKFSQKLWQQASKKIMNILCQSSQSTNPGKKLGTPKKIKR
ncbi:hypothetical protein CROQUDRAFT_666149 [Cronartium quercuum f. sp. fusiforme G11]|uniref:Uncharacterized protein n=1 Tax=Cronartium quercuum f. sp. fusiforme G11 TaxID=708437 RepID=A0A9P6T5G7_9BASI|nr:hypothetical protein CROQUDRAFT_666149 [Cronartium quercuum f. sp. fusiforme G11]